MFRFSIILGLVAGFMVFLTIPNSAEFFITLITVAINAIVAIATGIILFKKGETK
jgi:hypothetical protein